MLFLCKVNITLIWNTNFFDEQKISMPTTEATSAFTSNYYFKKKKGNKRSPF